MANKDSMIGQPPTLEQLQKKLDMLDRRLDDIDSTVSAVVERVMRQAITVNLTCAHCGKKIEIAILSKEKPTT